MLWTDEENRRLIATNYSWFLPTYDAYPHGIQRADAVRYFILHRFGGVYADMDVQPVRSIEDMVRGVTAAVGATPNLGVTNAFMVSVANGSFFHFVASSLPAHASRWYHVTRHWEILTSTGPTFLWKQLSQYGGPETVSVIPASVWGKCSICASQCPLVSKAYFRHLTGDSWHAWDSTLMTYGFFCHPNLTTFAAAFLVFLLAGWPHVVQHVVKHRQAVAIFWLTCAVLSVGSLDLIGLMLVFTLANLRRNIAAGAEPVHEKS
jgi:mannosyltransferase OCH1-like enzyme